MNDIKISVYITNFNYGKFISEAIESVLNQSIVNIELIIIDDGSTDNSKEIIERYSEYSNVRIIYQKNKGLNVSNNIALSLAKGKYIVRLDADDYFDKDALKYLSEELDADDDLGLVFPDYYLVNEQSQIISEVKRHDFGKDVTMFDQPAHGACTMIRIDFLKEVGGYYESFKCQDGYDLWIKFISDYKVRNVTKPLFYYRQHGYNLTKNESLLLRTRSEIKKKFLESRNSEIPKTIGVIPVRSLNSSKLVLEKLNNKTLLEYKIEAALKADLLNKIVIVASDQEIFDLINEKYNDPKILLIARPTEFSRFNSSLYSTLELIFNNEAVTGLNIQAFVLLAPEFPFTKPELIDTTVRSAVIFGSDTVISTRESPYSLYKHNGNSMVPIDSATFTKYERDSVYLSLGGLTFSTKENLFANKVLPSGRISHIIVDQISGVEVKTLIDLKLADYIAKMDMFDDVDSLKL